MARIVGIHGAFHQLWGPNQIASRWLPAVRDGLWHADVTIKPSDFRAAFYGDLFRTEPARGRPTDEELEDVARQSGLLELIEDQVGPGGLEVLAEEVGAETLRQTINQLGRYFADDGLRARVRSRLTEVIEPDTRVIVSHSMGTVVAYEALGANPEWPVTDLVTLGSPLGGDFVFASLDPSPVDGTGQWPGSITRWTNVAAVGDKACHEPRLARLFGDGVHDVEVDNGKRAHDPEPYLNAAATGRAMAAALS